MKILYESYNAPYLEHHGVKGQKWGVRHDPKPAARRRVVTGKAKKIGIRRKKTLLHPIAGEKVEAVPVPSPDAPWSELSQYFYRRASKEGYFNKPTETFYVGDVNNKHFEDVKLVNENNYITPEKVYDWKKNQKSWDKIEKDVRETMPLLEKQEAERIAAAKEASRKKQQEAYLRDFNQYRKSSLDERQIMGANKKPKTNSNDSSQSGGSQSWDNISVGSYDSNVQSWDNISVGSYDNNSQGTSEASDSEKETEKDKRKKKIAAVTSKAVNGVKKALNTASNTYSKTVSSCKKEIQKGKAFVSSLLGRF